jgi:hypothetical protein
VVLSGAVVALLVDQVYTAPMETVQPMPFGWNGT